MTYQIFDIMVGGFPCTSFSVAGYRKGFDDDRTGDLFLKWKEYLRKGNQELYF